MTDKLYRLVMGGEEFTRYDRHWAIYESLPAGVASVITDVYGEAVEFVVPVEPCEHGNYAEHVTHKFDDRGILISWGICDGKPLGKDGRDE